MLFFCSQRCKVRKGFMGLIPHAKVQSSQRFYGLNTARKVRKVRKAFMGLIPHAKSQSSQRFYGLNTARKVIKFAKVLRA